MNNTTTSQSDANTTVYDVTISSSVTDVLLLDNIPLTLVEENDVYFLLLHVFGIPLATFMCFISSVTLCVIYSNPLIRDKHLNIVISWTLADIILSVTLISRIYVGTALWSVETEKDEVSCLLWVCIQNYPIIVGFIHVVLLSVDRYAALLLPLAYVDRLTVVQLRVYIILGWIYGGALRYDLTFIYTYIL